MADIEQLPAEAQALADATRETEQAEGIPPDSELYAQFLGDKPEPSPVEAPAETPAEETTEPPVAEAEPAAEPEQEPALLAGKYKDVEALERAYLEAQRRIGEQGNELGQLRQLEDRFNDLQARLNQPQLDPGSFAALIDENPAQAVQVALQRQDGFGYEQAMRAWYDTDPYAAQQFHGQVQAQQLQQQIQQQQQPVIDQTQQLSNEQALRAVAGKYEDFDQVVSALTPDEVGELWQNNPVMQNVLRETAGGSAAEKEAVFETLYAFARLKQDGTVRQVAQQAAVEAAAAARTAKTEATVASASTTTPPDVPESEDERMTRVMHEFASGRNMRSAWTGQETRR